MSKLLATGVLSLGLAVLAAAPAAAGPTIRVGDNWFSPKSKTVAQHSTVTWRFVGNRMHNVTVTSGPARFSSPTRSSGRYRRHMMKRGTYTIVCSIHKGSQKMTLRVT
jgi:plastocyanin